MADNETEKAKQVAVRLSPELIRAIEAVPDKYGESFAQKARFVMHLGMEEHERREQWIEEGRYRARDAPEPPDDPGKPSGAADAG